MAKFWFKLRPLRDGPFRNFRVILPANYLSPVKCNFCLFSSESSSFPGRRVNEKACPHVNIRTNFQHPSSFASTMCVFLFSSWFCFLAFLSVSDKSFDSRFVLFLIYCHTQTFLFAFSHYLSLAFSVTLNVILYFTSFLPLPFLLLTLCHIVKCAFSVSASLFLYHLGSVKSV